MAAAENDREVAIVITAGEKFDPTGAGLAGMSLRATTKSLLDATFGRIETGRRASDTRQVAGRQQDLKFITVTMTPDSYDEFFGSSPYITRDVSYTLDVGAGGRPRDCQCTVVVCLVDQWPAAVLGGGKAMFDPSIPIGAPPPGLAAHLYVDEARNVRIDKAGPLRHAAACLVRDINTVLSTSGLMVRVVDTPTTVGDERGPTGTKIKVWLSDIARSPSSDAYAGKLVPAAAIYPLSVGAEGAAYAGSPDAGDRAAQLARNGVRVNWVFPGTTTALVRTAAGIGFRIGGMIDGDESGKPPASKVRLDARQKQRMRDRMADPDVRVAASRALMHGAGKFAAREVCPTFLAKIAQPPERGGATKEQAHSMLSSLCLRPRRDQGGVRQRALQDWRLPVGGGRRRQAVGSRPAGARGRRHLDGRANPTGEGAAHVHARRSAAARPSGPPPLLPAPRGSLARCAAARGNGRAPRASAPRAAHAACGGARRLLCLEPVRWPDRRSPRVGYPYPRLDAALDGGR